MIMNTLFYSFIYRLTTLIISFRYVRFEYDSELQRSRLYIMSEPEKASSALLK